MRAVNIYIFLRQKAYFFVELIKISHIIINQNSFPVILNSALAVKTRLVGLTGIIWLIKLWIIIGSWAQKFKFKFIPICAKLEINQEPDKQSGC